VYFTSRGEIEKVSPKPRKTFSLKEANALIPEIEKRLKRLQTKREVYTRLHDALFVRELVAAAEKTNGILENDDLEANIHDLEQAIEDLAKDVEAIFEKGCFLRSIEKGRVDFPADFENKRIFWSWETGEAKIRYYRHPKSPFSERIAIPTGVLTSLGGK